MMMEEDLRVRLISLNSEFQSLRSEKKKLKSKFHEAHEIATTLRAKRTKSTDLKIVSLLNLL